MAKNLTKVQREMLTRLNDGDCIRFGGVATYWFIGASQQLSYSQHFSKSTFTGLQSDGLVEEMEAPPVEEHPSTQPRWYTISQAGRDALTGGAK
jgi:hypothetical protein